MRPGDRVRCRYRINDLTGHRHTGTLLAVDDPRAWVDSIALGPGTPDVAAVRAHLAWCADQRVQWDSLPVAWDFGAVMWDRERDLFPAGVGS